MEETPTEAEEVEVPEPSLRVHELTIRRCKLVAGRLVPRGDAEKLDLMDAICILAPRGTRNAKINVMRARRGDFIGLRNGAGSNFVIRNPTDDGDIRWLLNKSPGFEHSFSGIWLIQDVIRRAVPIEVTTQNGYGYSPG